MTNSVKSNYKNTLFIHAGENFEVLTMYSAPEYEILYDNVLNQGKSALKSTFVSEYGDSIKKAVAQKRVQLNEFQTNTGILHLSIVPLYNEELIFLFTKCRDTVNDKVSGITTDLSLVLSHLEEGVLLEDAGRKVLFINDKFRKMLNLKREINFYKGTSTLNLIYELSRTFMNMESFYELFTSIHNYGNGASSGEITLNESLIIEREFIPIEEHGQTTAYLWKLRDITERKKSESKLQGYLDLMLEQTQATNQIQSAIITKGVEQYNDVVVSTYFPYYMDSLGSLSDMIRITDDKYLYFIADISSAGAKSILYASAVKSVIFKMSGELESLSADEILKLVLSKLQNNLKIDLENNAELKVVLGLFDMKSRVLNTASLNTPEIIVYDNQQDTVQNILSASDIDSVEQSSIILTDTTKIFFFTEGIYSLNRDGETLDSKVLSELIKKYYKNFSYSSLLPDNFERIMRLEGYNNSGKNFIFVNMCTKILTDEILQIKAREKNHLYCIPSMLSEVGKIGRYCELLTKKWTNNTWLGYKVELIVNEFLNNIIVHGLESRKDAYIFVLLTLGDFLEVTFIDEGREWSMSLEKDKTDETKEMIKNLDEASFLNERGRGIFMIKELVRESFRKRQENLNFTQFRLSLNKE